MLDDAIAHGVLGYYQKHLNIENEGRQVTFLLKCAKRYIISEARHAQTKRNNRRDYGAYYNGMLQRRLKETSYGYPNKYLEISMLMEDGKSIVEISNILKIGYEAAKKRVQKLRSILSKERVATP